MKRTTLISEGRFYKGNIHCHSNCSDGKLSPETLAAAYKERGYQFLAFTEHNLYSDYSRFDTPDFITLPGIEANPAMPDGEYRAYHFVAIPGGDAQKAGAVLPSFVHGERTASEPFQNYEDLQRYIDNLYDRGYQILFAHPFWSRIEYDQILPLERLFAVEIFNYCSQVAENMGESNVCYDALLRGGKKLWCAAVDDNHNETSLTGASCDSFGGFIAVKARSLCERDLCNAIAAGSFYASQGPEIHDFYLEDGIVHFSCSRCAKIYLNGHIRQIRSRVAENEGPLLTEFHSELFGDETYIRMECYDAAGRKAYTNPIWL